MDFGYADNVKSVVDWLNQFAVFRGLLWFLVVYVVVLVLDLVLLLATRGLGSDIQQGLSGATDRPKKSQYALRSQWKKIESRLEKGSPSERKVAVLEADQLVDTVLVQMGYDGENLQERISQLSALGVEQSSRVEEAHAIRNRIIYESGFSLDQEEAKRILGLYREFLEQWEVI